MNSSQQLTKPTIVVSMSVFLFILLAATSPAGVEGRRLHGDLLSVVERRAANPACRSARWTIINVISGVTEQLGALGHNLALGP